MNDMIDEELTIANEQDSEGTILTASSFLYPVRRLKTPKIVALPKSTNLKEAIGLMQDKNIGSVVVEDQGKLVGIFTERDVLMRVISKIENWEAVAIEDVMTANPQSLRMEDEIAYVLNNMHIAGYRHVPIVDENDKPISMVSIKDVVSFILDYFPNEICNMTGEPFRGEYTRDGG